MAGKTLIPLIDLVFLTLGSVLGAMTEMERVTALPVELSELPGQSAPVAREETEMLRLAEDGLSYDGRPIALAEAPGLVGGRQTVLRVARNVPTEQTLQTLDALATAGVSVSVEVKRAAGPDARAAKGER
jgi:hypothetical protein